ncbi:MAG TPA: hypothetical protein VIY08_06705 [Candidatus Nitrosocosmicus sp.]
MNNIQKITIFVIAIFAAGMYIGQIDMNLGANSAYAWSNDCSLCHPHYPHYHFFIHPHVCGCACHPFFFNHFQPRFFYHHFPYCFR